MVNLNSIVPRLLFPVYKFKRKTNLSKFYWTQGITTIYKAGTEYDEIKTVFIKDKDYLTKYKEYENKAKNKFYVKGGEGICFIFYGGLNFFVGGENFSAKILKSPKNFNLDFINYSTDIYEFINYHFKLDLNFYSDLLKKDVSNLKDILRVLNLKLNLRQPILIKLIKDNLIIRNVDIITKRHYGVNHIIDYNLKEIDINSHIILGYDLQGASSSSKIKELN